MTKKLETNWDIFKWYFKHFINRDCPRCWGEGHTIIDRFGFELPDGSDEYRDCWACGGKGTVKLWKYPFVWCKVNEFKGE